MRSTGRRTVRWLAYAKANANCCTTLRVFARGRQNTALTNGLTDDIEPRIDPSGRYLWSLTKRTFTPRFSDFEQTFNFNATTVDHRHSAARRRAIAVRAALR
jgi:tricorn protease-like protein